NGSRNGMGPLAKWGPYSDQMAEEAFDVLITSDQKLKYQQNSRAERSASSSCRQIICGRYWNSHPKSPVHCRKCLPAFFSKFSPEYFQLSRNGGRSVPPFPTWTCSRREFQRRRRDALLFASGLLCI